MIINTIYKKIYGFCKSITEKLVPIQQNQMMKLSKWISLKSLCSRKQAQEFIQLGLVRIDGQRIYKNIMVPYDANIKAFTMQGIRTQKPVSRLWMINKPRGYICSHRDPQNRPTIYSLLPPFFKNYGHIISVGRLDYNSQGLLLLTNDVKLKNLLENPISNMTRLYRVKVHGRVSPQKLLQMSKPIIINKQRYGPLQVTVDRALKTNVWLNVAMKTGKNRQIRRIMQKCDLQVNKLIRLQYGKYKLSNLAHGDIRQLPVSIGLQKKLKYEKAKELSKNDKKCLIQIDIRKQAIQIAAQEHRHQLQNKKQIQKQLNDKTNNKTLSLKNNDEQEEQSTSED